MASLKPGKCTATPATDHVTDAPALGWLRGEIFTRQRDKGIQQTQASSDVSIGHGMSKIFANIIFLAPEMPHGYKRDSTIARRIKAVSKTWLPAVVSALSAS